MTHMLYHTFGGRCILKILTLPPITKTVGFILNTPLSKPYINLFIKKHKINMDEFVTKKYKSFNDFFVRNIIDGKREIDYCPNSLISPCDGYLSVYTIDNNSKLNIKGTTYTVSELFENKNISKAYCDGICLVFRLTPQDYHRYIYTDNGTKDANTPIKGILHTVRPVALECCPVFKTNSREYTTLHTENLGDIIFMEVGAMLVGKICNHHNSHSFKRGEEKGYFEFGGSTIIMIIKKDIVKINKEILDASSDDTEYRVRLGEKIGTKI